MSFGYERERSVILSKRSIMSEPGRENSLISLYSNSDCDNESSKENVYIDYDEL